MDSANLKFFVAVMMKNDHNGAAIHHHLEKACGANAITYRRVTQIMNEVKRDDDEVEEISCERKEGSGRPRSSRSEDNIEWVRDILYYDCTLSTPVIAAMTGIHQKSVQRIIKDHLGKKCVHAKWMPHLLSDEQKANRVVQCKEIRKALRTRNIQKRLIVVDEKWVYSRCIPPLHTVKAWVDKDGDRPTVAKRSIADKKFMIMVAGTFDARFHFKVMEYGQTVDSAAYMNFLTDVFQQIPNELTLLMHDNARPHVAKSVQDFLSERDVVLLKQPAYSPDTNLMDRSVFRNFETFRRDIVYENVAHLTSSLKTFFSQITADQLNREFTALKSDIEQIIDNGGDYL